MAKWALKQSKLAVGTLIATNKAKQIRLKNLFVFKSVKSEVLYWNTTKKPKQAFNQNQLFKTRGSRKYKNESRAKKVLSKIVK